METAPIGTIIAWHKSLTETPSLPTGWMECDGLDGRPNLNGTTNETKIFLRGATSSGATGGNTTHRHTVNLKDDGHSNGYHICGGHSSTNEAIPNNFEVVWIIKVT